jgi:multidrug resistance efflux pump
MAAWAKAASLLIIAIALVLAIHVANRWWETPSTDDATIDADVVHVAAAVGGRIISIPISENSYVKRGDLLFQIDPLPFELAVDRRSRTGSRAGGPGHAAACPVDPAFDRDGRR